MSTEDLVMLIYDAYDRVTNVRVTMRRTSRDQFTAAARGGTGPHQVESGGIVEATTRFWRGHSGFSRWESEVTVAGSRAVAVGVRRGQAFWHRINGRIYTNEDATGASAIAIPEELVVDPSVLLGAYRFAAVGTGSLVDRAAIAAVADARLGIAHRPLIAEIGDRLHLLIDRETGLGLQLRCDAPDLSLAVTDISFEASLPESLFEPLR